MTNGSAAWVDPGWRTGLTSWLATLRLLTRFQGKNTDPAKYPVKVPCGRYQVDQYLPAGKPSGTVIFIHGMAALGAEDPRVQQLARALTAAGLKVLIPHLPTIRELRIERDQPAEVQSVLEQIAADRGLVPTGRFAAMAVSFSGVFALRAACSSTLGQRITALCLIGGYYDVDQVSDFLVNARRSDPYGRMLMLRSYYREVEPESDDFHQALEHCIRESAKLEGGWNLRVLLDPTDPLQERLYQLLDDTDQREQFHRKVIAAFGNDWRSYRVSLDFVNRKTPVFLLHGRADRVIPPGESRRLARQMTERGIPNYLCVTRFLSHGDSAISIARLPELYRLLKGFAGFVSGARD